MKKIILLLTFFVSFSVVNAASITYIQQFQYKPSGGAITPGLPEGLTENDIVWVFTLISGGTDLCSKTNGDQKITWDLTAGTYMGNLSIFNSCGSGAKAGDAVRMEMTINKPGHAYHGAKGTSTVTVTNGYTVAKEGDAITFEEPVILPKISVASVSLCAGEVKTVTATITDAPADIASYTIDWGNSNITTTGGVTSSGATANISTSLAAGTYSLTAKLKKGTSDVASASYTVTVNQKPTVTLATTPANREVCVGSTLKVTPTVTGGTGTASYEWTWSGASGTASTQAELSFTVNSNSPTTYNLVVSKSGCKSEQATVSVTINQRPTISLSASADKLCAGKNVSLTATASGGSGSYLKYNWNPSSLGTGSTANPALNTTPGNNTYSVNVEDSKGCTAATAATKTVVGYRPTVTLVAREPSVQSGATTLLTATPSGGEGSYTYIWTGVTSSGNTATTPPLSSDTQFKVKVQDGASCESAEATVTVVVGKAADLVVNPPATTPKGNVGDPINATVTVSGGDGQYTYKWKAPAGVTVTGTGASVTVSSSDPGLKEVCVEVSSGGQTKESCFNVMVIDPSVIGLFMTVDRQCATPGAFLTLTIRGQGADTYSFKLLDKTNAVVMTVTDKATWDTYRVNLDAEGTFRISDFKYKINGVESTGERPDPIDAKFDVVPEVKILGLADGETTMLHCEGEVLTLKGAGDPGLKYTWDKGVSDGVPFDITVGGTYTVTGEDPNTGCKNTSSVEVTLNPRPVVVMPESQEVCAEELVTLTATSPDPDVTFTWNNGVINDQPFKPMLTAVYEVNATNAAGCVKTDSVKVSVNQAPHIVDHSKTPRRIAIGKDADFRVTVDAEATYEWFKKEEDQWVLLQDITSSTPIIIGSTTDSISLLSVPKTWDGTELKVVATGLCGKDSMEFLLNVSECFEIGAELEMIAGIIPDEEPGNGIDGWYCRGQEISLKTVITSEEDYDIENAHYRWLIDGEDLAEEHIEMVSDTAVLTWIPSQFIENDFVVRVYAYCDGACEEVAARRIRLKAREYEDVAVKIMTDRDPFDHFCAGDTVNFWLATKNVGNTPQYTWYNDIFELPNQQSPYNELIALEHDQMTLVMGQEDSWIRVVMTPSPEVCMREPMLSDSLIMRKKPWVEPSLSIDYADTMVCKGDTVPMWAVQANAGSDPTFQWQRSIGAPFPDWNLGTDYFATVFVDEEDVWVKCTMTPSKDVCYDKSEPIIAAVKISVFKEDPEVIITCDMEDKTAGEELIFEAEVRNILGEPIYEWYVDEMLAPVNEAEYITDNLKQGSVVYCLVSGEKVCQTKVKSNEIIVDFGAVNRDTMLVIYRDERIKDLNMLKTGDVPSALIFMIETPASFGMASISPDGLFTYIPNTGFIGTDHVKYVILNRSDKSMVSEGYIYITVKESDRFFVPNLITPNDDGLNDTWVLDFLADYPNHLIQVFDRDGRIVFEARNYQNDWGGEGITKSGYVGHINLVNGIYTYIIDLGDKDKTVLRSWLEIRANLNRRNYR